ncbi:hypothetical protein [Phormidesmis sp. 146-33]
MVNVGYHTARLRGRITRSIYKAALPQIVRQPIAQTQKTPVTVYALSCERDLPEQIASIRSLIQHVGIPEQFIVISDGSYTESSCNLLHQIHPCVQVVSINQLIRKDLPQAVYEYAAQQAMGKKLAALLSLPITGATIYTDSDILFFPGAADLIDLLLSEDRICRYLPDCAAKFDQRIIYSQSENLNPINAGFVLFKDYLNWDFALHRLSKLKELNNYFTEQTLVHLTLHHNQALPLNPDQYVLSVEDQFIYCDKYASGEIALRHYVNDVRHKFWFNVGL